MCSSADSTVAVHGSLLPTSDVDIVPSRDDDSLARALNRLHARLRTESGPVDVRIDAVFLKAMPFMLNLGTDEGDVDLAFCPARPLNGYRDWEADAIEVEIAPELKVRVAALDAITDSKRSAGRAKDLHALPYLESLRDDIAARRLHEPD